MKIRDIEVFQVSWTPGDKPGAAQRLGQDLLR